MRVGRVVMAAVAIVLVSCACGGGDSASAPPTDPVRSTTTELDGSSSSTTTAASDATTTSTTLVPGELAAFIELAEDVDASLGALATRINATFPVPPDGLHDDLLAVAGSLEELRGALTIGLDAEVEAAAVLVYSDLDGRTAALAASDPLGEMALTDPDELLACFANGSPAARAFASDLTELRELMVDRPGPGASADDGLDLEVRLATIETLNGAPRCGGFRATDELVVEWDDGEGGRRDGQVVLPDGTRLAFDVELVDGKWSITTDDDAGSSRSTLLDLAPFVREVNALDAALDAAAAVIGDPTAPSLDTASLERFRTELEAVGFDGVDDAMPDGLPADVEAAAVLVYSDLVSRYTAFDNGVYPGMMQYEPREVIDDVLATAATADAALDGDVAALEQLAEAVPSTGGATAGSRDAASLAVRRSFVWLANGGCAQTGGYRALEPIAVDWLDAPTSDQAVRVDGTVETIAFTAELDGDEWVIGIHAC